MKTVFQRTALVCTFLLIALFIYTYTRVSTSEGSSNWPFTTIIVLMVVSTVCVVCGWIILPLMEPVKPAVIVSAKSKTIELLQQVSDIPPASVPETSTQPPVRSAPLQRPKATIILKRESTTIIANVAPQKKE